MPKNGKSQLLAGAALLAAFILWTVLVRTVDVRPLGAQGTMIGFAGLNTWFHRLTGVNMRMYTLTDWLSAVPFLVCAAFGLLGLRQWVKRRSLRLVDRDILLLGGHYLLVIGAYLLFERLHINDRPVLIDGRLEASYPSSTTLLVLSVMPTLIFQLRRRMKPSAARKLACAAAALFTALMVLGRTVAGVHWLTDICGGVLLSAGLYLVYRGAVLLGEA